MNDYIVFPTRIFRFLAGTVLSLLLLLVLQAVLPGDITLAEQNQVLYKKSASTLAVQAAAAVTLPDGFSNTTVFKGLTEPTSIRFASDGRVFVAEKSGLIKVFDNLTDTTPTVFADLRSQVYDYWDRGLLSIELHPNFPTKPYIYAFYTRDAAPGGNAPYYNDACADPTGDGCPAMGRLSRLTASGNVMTGTEQVLLTDWCVQYPSHNVGTIKFAPDGSLYVSGGDGASFTFTDYGQHNNPCNDPINEGGSLRSQDIRTTSDPLGYNGSLIRIDENGAPLPTNPLYGGDSKDDRMVAYGFRNPFRFTFKPGTSEIWVGDVGQGATEEVDRIFNPLATPLQNFGWPCYEGPVKNQGFEATNLQLCRDLYTAGTANMPYYSYDHDGLSTSISGIEFYSGTSYPDKYKNALFFADYSRAFIKAMLPDSSGMPNTNDIETIIDGGANPVDLEKGPDGNIYYVDLSLGEIHRLDYLRGNRTPTAKIASDKTYGSLPLTVKFDATGSSDPEGDALTYSWDLNGDGTFGDSTLSNPQFTYTQSKDYKVQLKVTDSANASSTASLTISAGNRPPSVTITKPLSTTKWKVGDTIQFSGTGTDPDTGAVAANKLNWQVIMHHCAADNPTNCHEHPLQTFTGVAGGSFIAPDHEYPSYLEFQLSTTDARGLKTTSSVDIQPQTTTVTFQSNPSGMDVVLYDKRHTTPYSRQIITNGKTTVSAITPQVLNADEYKFGSWSDNGAQTHEFTATGSAMTLTASYSLTTDVTWSSYNSVTQSGSPQGYVKDSRGANPATLEFYESTNNSGVDKGSLFSTFHSGYHPDGTNNVENYWSNEAGLSYTYVGKSTVDRGYDMGEQNAPSPVGVRDLQIHPPNSDHMTVAAFVVPKTGNYSVSNLAARRVDGTTGETSVYKVFNQRKELLASIKADSTTWTSGTTSSYSLGQLKAGDRIYFAVERDGIYWWDYTEVAWTISLTQPVTETQPSSVTTSVPGLKVFINNTPTAAPASTSAGTNYVVYAPTVQTTTDGKTAKFTGWSDGGAQEHTITARANNVVTAYYSLQPTATPSFQNGFEEGNTSVYPQGNINIAPGNSLEVKTTKPRNGKYSLEVASDGTGAATEAVIDWTTYPPMNTIYLQSHFSLANATMKSGDIMNIIALKNVDYRRLLYISLGSDYKLRLYKFNPADEGYCEPDICGKGTLLGTFGPEIPRDGSWHEIQLRYTVDAAHGGIEVWLDGNRIAELLNVNTGTAGVDDIHVMTWGSFYSSHNIVSKAYFDDFALSSTYIPPKPVVSSDPEWHSYDTVMNSNNNQGTVTSNTDEKMSLQFYKSTNTNGVDMNQVFTTFNDRPHTEGTNKVENYWANGTGAAYPYIGKSTIVRGSDTNESNTPNPTGVRDLQIHPADDDTLTVAAATIPSSGNYILKDLAARRVDGNPGQSAKYKVFNQKKEQIAEIQTTSQAWAQDSNTYSLGALNAGDKIYFAVARDGVYWWDATEINWTLAKSSGTTTPTQTSWNSYDATINSSGTQATVNSEAGGDTASLAFYESNSLTDLGIGRNFTFYQPNDHTDAFNHVKSYWGIDASSIYPYVGKSTVARGSDTNETNTPSPTGKFDLQVHPPDRATSSVVAFTVPKNGNYSVSNLAVRRVDGNANQTALFKVFNNQQVSVAQLTASSQAWTTDSGTYNIGNLTTGQKIYFTVEKNGEYWWDATEINWKITQQ